VKHCLRIGLLSCLALAVWLSVHAAPAPQKTQITLKLTLPESGEYPGRGGYKLVIDGKDYSEPKEFTRSVKVPVKDGQETVKVQYTFWPNNYTAITRSKVVTLAKGKTAYSLNLLKEDTKNKDHIEVIFVPTPPDIMEEMIKMAKVGKDDVVWDIGCGDGTMVIMAVEKFGAKRGVGIDIDPDRIKDSKENLKKTKVEQKIEFKVGDALKIKDVSEASVVLLYMGDDIGARLRPVLQDTLKPGSRVVSHRFTLGGWTPDRSITIKGKDGDDYELHLWTIKEKKKQ
jgi:precorrin-6B methylase 2